MADELASPAVSHSSQAVQFVDLGLRQPDGEVLPRFGPALDRLHPQIVGQPVGEGRDAVRVWRQVGWLCLIREGGQHFPSRLRISADCSFQLPPLPLTAMPFKVLAPVRPGDR